jgi:hypothetical protein
MLTRKVLAISEHCKFDLFAQIEWGVAFLNIYVLVPNPPGRQAPGPALTIRISTGGLGGTQRRTCESSVLAEAAAALDLK